MSNWQKVNLDKLCFFEKGKTGLAKAIPGDYPLVTTSAERKTNDSYQFDTKAVCIPLVSSTGHGHASLNYVHYQEGKFALGTILVALIPKDETILNAQFLHLYLSRLKDMILVPLMSGAANVSLSISKIKIVEIPLPPIDEQLKIVELFKNLVNENNELVEEINTQQSLLKQLKQTILQEAIEGKLTAKYRAKNPDIGTVKELLEQIKIEKEKLVKEKKIKPSKPLAPINEDEIPFDIPQSWEWCKFGNIVEHNAGKTLDRGRNKGLAQKYITTSNLYWGYFILDDLKEMLIDESELSKCTVQKGDLLVCEGGEAGRSAVWENDETICIQNHIHRVRPYQNINTYYLYYYLMKIFLTGEIDNYRNGMGIKNLSGKSLSTIIIPIAPKEEQKEIVATIEKLFAICDELEAEINQNKTTVDNLMATVLKEAFEN
ncbi:restriction endonuclease subunit S [Aliarcobacter butzleri]|uniref:restriction endonuclease subunit S n=1 Tax=Aliarcobacter butzleri TaxID=28197 RepID=UPI001EDC5804|nr:restriction endonuclease subunit S [Aliarcobacter butzleri]MCG3705035.1 restriction endonuclease subunit S [Aliarcobacter butzleri]